MSFTQEKLNPQANTGADETPRCNGCDCHCKFGIHYFYSDVPRADMPSLSVRHFCPTIDGKIIEEYWDQNRQLSFASKRDEGKTDYDYRHVQSAEVYAVEKARQIAKLCDHYKTTFTQQQGLNIGENFKYPQISFSHITPDQKTTKCDGCDKQCEIGTIIFCDTIFPTISGERISDYKSEDGEHQIFENNNIHDIKNSTIARIKTLQFGQTLASLCDHYKTR